MQEHAHYWKLEKSGEPFISRGECQCGAVRFFSNDGSPVSGKEVLKRVEELNRTEGKKGNMVNAKALAPALRTVSDREADKEAMLADYYALSLVSFYQKWSLAPDTWQKLKKLWNVAAKGHRGGPGKKDAQKVGDSLPPFPVFNDNWPEAVMVTWLDTYKALKEKDNA